MLIKSLENRTRFRTFALLIKELIIKFNKVDLS